MKLIWSPLAIERAMEIAQYIAQDNPAAAQKWVQSIFLKAERLPSSPESGRVVPEVNRKEIRELIHGNYRIIYRITPDTISILTVRHGRKMLPVGELLA